MAAFAGIGAPELLIILLIILLLFGSKKLPELARSLGTSARELKTSMKPEETSAGASSKPVVAADGRKARD